MDGLTKHLTSLRITLATGNVSWINEFLSRRHGGLTALENVLDKFVTKKSKYVCTSFVRKILCINFKQRKKNGNKLNDNEEQCLFECIKCIRVLLNTKVTHLRRRGSLCSLLLYTHTYISY